MVFSESKDDRSTQNNDVNTFYQAFVEENALNFWKNIPQRNYRIIIFKNRNEDVVVEPQHTEKQEHEVRKRRTNSSTKWRGMNAMRRHSNRGFEALNMCGIIPRKSCCISAFPYATKYVTYLLWFQGASVPSGSELYFMPAGLPYPSFGRTAVTWWGMQVGSEGDKLVCWGEVGMGGGGRRGGGGQLHTLSQKCWR